MREMTAVETMSAVSAAIAAWVDAFKSLGVEMTDSKTSVFWVEGAGVWIKPRVDPEAYGGHWNGLGVELTSHALRNELAQVNPPLSGSPPGSNQGVIAIDEGGVVWVLRRSRLAIAGRKLELDDFPLIAERLGIEPVIVKYQNGSTMRCYPVAPLGDPNATLASTRRFVDLCRLARTNTFDGAEAAEIDQRVFGFEEPAGTYTIPARGPVEANRFHHDVCEALKSSLTERDFTHTNAKFGLLGPDLYTVGKGTPMIFEIKTGNIADDVLKAVGQLFVYEKLIGKACRKVMILPAGIRNSNRDLVNSLGIAVVDYAWEPTISFDWPRAFFDAT
jgi:hypothetical protein